MMGYGDFGGMGGFGWLWMLVVVGLVIGLVVWGSGPVFRSRGSTGEPSPLEILRRRYIAGEITAAEFEQARQMLA